MLKPTIKADFLASAWVLIPATGIGARAGMPVPKQYLEINGQSILNHTIGIFKKFGFKNILVILHAEDKYFKYHEGIHTCVGGKTRYLSVTSGLKYIKQQKTEKNTWVLVHDAVRPCLNKADLFTLISKILACENHSGGILAKPLADTLKFAQNNNIQHTVPRHDLFQALTPQMFTLETLEQAFDNIHNLSEAEINNITDEAYLIEKLNLKPIIAEALHPNPKLTYPEDIDYIRYLLEKTPC